MADDFPPVLDAEMTARLLNLNIDTVRRLSRQEVIPAHRAPGGRAFMYLKDELLDWVRQQPANTPAATTDDAENAPEAATPDAEA